MAAGEVDDPRVAEAFAPVRLDDCPSLWPVLPWFRAYVPIPSDDLV